MPPANGQPTGQSNNDVLAAINTMKADIQKSIDERFEAQKTENEERFKAVDSISDTLEKARQSTIEQQRKAQEQNQPGWKPSTWDDIPKLVQTEAARIAEETLKKRDQQFEQQEQRRVNDEAALEAEIDNSLRQLEQSGYLPPVRNPNDYNDAGVSARRELLGAASTLGTPDLDQVANTLTQLHRQNMVFDTNTKTYISAEDSLAPLPGKFAPVGNSSVNAPSQFAGPTTAELRNRNMDDLVALAERRGYGPAPTNVASSPDGY